jgi:hypothetical protein
MKYGDLSSIVQLGVGLHIGTAILQLYSELALTPFDRRLARIRALFSLPKKERPSEAIDQRLRILEGRVTRMKILFFKQYRWLVKANGCVAVALAVLLIIIAIKADDPIRDHYWFAVFAIALSFLPAPITLGTLARDAHNSLKPLKEEATQIEHEAFAPLKC